MTNGFYTTITHHGISFLVYMQEGALVDVLLADIFHASNKNLLRCLSPETIKVLSVAAVKNEMNGEVEYAES